MTEDERAEILAAAAAAEAAAPDLTPAQREALNTVTRAARRALAAER